MIGFPRNHNPEKNLKEIIKKYKAQQSMTGMISEVTMHIILE